MITKVVQLIGLYAPACPIRLLFNMQCPGCGLTTSILLCMQGDFAGAVRTHPLGPAALVELAVLCGLWVLGSRSPSMRERRPRIFRCAARWNFSLVVAVWVFRTCAGVIQ